MPSWVVSISNSFSSSMLSPGNNSTSSRAFELSPADAGLIFIDGEEIRGVEDVIGFQGQARSLYG